MVFGVATEVNDPGEKQDALRAVIEHVAPGRSEEVRGPNATELRSTRVLSLPIEEASAKVRTGPPVDDDDDLGLPSWAGRLPVSVSAGEAIPAPDLAVDLPVPEHVSAWSRRRNGLRT